MHYSLRYRGAQTVLCSGCSGDVDVEADVSTRPNGQVGMWRIHHGTAVWTFEFNITGIEATFNDAADAADGVAERRDVVLIDETWSSRRRITSYVSRSRTDVLLCRLQA